MKEVKALLSILLLSILLLAGYREKQIEQWLQDDGR